MPAPPHTVQTARLLRTQTPAPSLAPPMASSHGNRPVNGPPQGPATRGSYEQPTQSRRRGEGGQVLACNISARASLVVSALSSEPPCWPSSRKEPAPNRRALLATRATALNRATAERAHTTPEREPLQAASTGPEQAAKASHPHPMPRSVCSGLSHLTHLGAPRLEPQARTLSPTGQGPTPER